MKKIILLISILILFFQSKSQNIITKNDASKFIEAYFSPIGESFGAGMNNGWYNTAKPHKFLGFDFTVTLNMVSIPEEMLTFDPNQISGTDGSFSLNEAQLPDENFSGDETPTILGSGEGAVIRYERVNDYADATVFDMPYQGSVNKNLIPVPMISGGIGLIKKTELDFRYLPNYNFSFGFLNDGSIGLWGLGLKHDLLQYIPVIGNTIPLDLSLQFGHTQFNTSFSFNPLEESSMDNIEQDISIKVNATTFNLIASKKILMLTGYVSLGYNASNTIFNSNDNGEFRFNARYPTYTFNLPNEIKFQSENHMRSNIGARINLSIISIQFNHTFSKYPVTTLGVGVSLR